jgi:hypothetical protein
MAETGEASETKAITKYSSDGLLHVSELNRRMQELIGHFILMEEYFMVESVRKVSSLSFNRNVGGHYNKLNRRFAWTNQWKIVSLHRRWITYFS